jgi:hypothetical protein
MTDAGDDYDVAPDVARWWNKASIEERCFFMGRAGSLDPTKAHQARQDVLARAEEAIAAELTHQEVVAKAKAAALDAASRISTNGAGTQH